jgi:hypothetical protein
MTTPASKRLYVAYVVVAILMALMMCVSASFKLTWHPDAVHKIHEVVGVPLGLMPVLAALEIAGGLGLVVGMFRPKIGVAAGIGLVCYFVGAIVAHVRVADWAGISAPITPLLMAVAALTFRVLSLRAAAPA